MNRIATGAAASALAAAVALPAAHADNWTMRHGLTGAQYDHYLNNEIPASFRPVSVAAHGTGSDARYTLACINDDEEDWGAMHGQSSDQYQSEGAVHVGNGYRVISIDASGNYPNERYASLWINDGTPASDWAAVHRLSESEMDAAIVNFQNAGLRPVSVTGSGDGSKRRFAAAFVRNDEQWSYETYLDLTHSQYQNLIEDQSQRGFRLLTFSGYGSNDPRFCAVFVRPDGPNWEKQPAWFARHEQSSGEFQQTVDDHHNVTKFVPTAVARYDGGRYGSAWMELKNEPVFTATGDEQIGISHFDAVMESFMTSRKFQRGALAVTKDGRLVYNRAFTYDDPDVWKTQPHHRFRVASVSKPITAVATLKAVDMGLFDLSDALFTIDGFDSPGWLVDDDVPGTVTIDMLLKHQGGWDRDLDPMLDDVDIADELGVSLPLSFEDIFDATKDQPLEFDAGTGYEYSNFGYALLGHVIELTSGQSYESFVREHVLCPLGAENMVTANTRVQDLHPDEVNYTDLMYSHFPSVMSDDRPLELRPYARFNVENMDAHGGWVATAEELARFVSDFTFETSSTLLTADQIDYMFNENAQTNVYGAGWQRSGSVRFHNGLLAGTWAYIIRMDNGVTLSVVFNTDSGGFNIPTAGNDGDIRAMLQDAANQVDDSAGLSWPTGDLFDENLCGRLAGDLNGDGVVSSRDLGMLLAEWGARSRPSDLDGDGITGSGDLGILLASWGV